MNDLNENHRRHLVTTFAYVDDILSEALAAVSRSTSPFARYIADLAPAQRRAIEDQLRELRSRMAGVLDRAQIGMPSPSISGRWGLQTALLSARIEIEEIRPRYMQGYGEVPPDAAQLLEEAASDLFDQLDRINAYLIAPGAADMPERVREWANAQVSESKHLEPLLSEFARTIGEQQVAYLRTPFNALLDRAQSAEFEIALFGRVSSGKSSLLDYLLQTDLLPVGVTPVTAFPTRIKYGQTPRLKAWFVGNTPAVLSTSALADLVTEQRNPENARHVTRIELELSSDRLREGIVFVDTPGLGSLALRGASETLAYLPRCDLGLVLVDSTLVLEDIRIVESLRRAGADVMVLLTKADRLSAEERSLALEYAKRQLREQLDAEIPVHLVSVRGKDATLCDHWAALVLDARQRDAQRRLAESLGRKAEILYQALVAELRSRLANEVHASQKPTELPASYRATMVRLEMLERQRVSDTDAIQGVVSQMLDAAAERASFESLETYRIEQILQQAFSHTILALGTEIQQIFDELRMQISTACENIEPANTELGIIPAITGMPVPVVRAFHLDAPLQLGLGRLRNRHGRQHVIRQQLERLAGRKLEEATREYVMRLETWRREMLRELRKAFQACSDLSQAGAHSADAIAGDLTTLKQDLKRLISLHDAWLQGRRTGPANYADPQEKVSQ
ncbi:MAG: dynamin family protein [Phycisphaerae bacterium]